VGLPAELRAVVVRFTLLSAESLLPVSSAFDWCRRGMALTGPLVMVFVTPLRPAGVRSTAKAGAAAPTMAMDPAGCPGRCRFD
jgi:hypothetical protein